MKTRKAYTGLLSMRAFCHDCDWTLESKNALGVAANHSSHHQHDVSIETTLVKSYRWKEEGSNEQKTSEKAQT